MPELTARRAPIDTDALKAQVDLRAWSARTPSSAGRPRHRAASGPAPARSAVAMIACVSSPTGPAGACGPADTARLASAGPTRSPTSRSDVASTSVRRAAGLGMAGGSPELIPPVAAGGQGEYG